MPGPLKQAGDFFRLVTDYAALLVVLSCVGTELILIGVEIYLMVLNFTRMMSLFGPGQAPPRGYEVDGATAECGYTSLTTSPKHLGGIYFTGFFQASIVLWLVLLAAADCLVFHRAAIKKKAEMLIYGAHITGLTAEEGVGFPPYYLIATMLLKWFVGVCYMSQSFVAVPHGDGSGPDTNYFVLFMGWVLLVSAPLGVFGQVFWLNNTIQRNKPAAGAAGED